MTAISNLKQFLEQRGFGEEKIDDVSRTTYKYTQCGAWCEKTEDGVSVGSIVEGVDYGTETHTLTYPFNLDEFWEKLQLVEDEAKQIWDDTHGCEDCHNGVELDGATPIDVFCETCKGEGRII